MCVTDTVTDLKSRQRLACLPPERQKNDKNEGCGVVTHIGALKMPEEFGGEVSVELDFIKWKKSDVWGSIHCLNFLE